MTVIPADFGGDVFVAPANPLAVDQPAQVLTSGAAGPFVAGKLSYGIQVDTPYTVRSLVRRLTGSGALTASQLARGGHRLSALGGPLPGHPTRIDRRERAQHGPGHS